MQQQLILTCGIFLLSAFAVAMPCAPQTAQTGGYQVPPQNVVDILTSQPNPTIRLSPDSQWMLQLQGDAMPDIADVSRRMLGLAGTRIDPAANAPFRTTLYRSASLRQAISKPDGAAPVNIPLPDTGKIASASWSHNSQHITITLITPKGQQLWMVSVAQPDQPRMLTADLNTVLARPIWLPDGKQILCLLNPEQRGPEPSAPAAPTGPNIQESIGNSSPTRTYQDLLRNAHDEALFEYYATTQMAVIRRDGSVERLGKKGLIEDVQVSPDGQYLLVETLQKPFSYLLTRGGFPRVIEVMDYAGKVLHTVAALPMQENIPIGGVATGPRRVGWMASRNSTLAWAEALDGGDPKAEVSHRDQVFMQAAPFKEGPVPFLKTEHRFWTLTYFSNPHWVLTREYDRERRWLRTLLHDLNEPRANPRVMEDRSMRDRYGNPGSLVMIPNATGQSVVRQEGNWVYLRGQGASDKGDLPFLDRRDLETMGLERIWRCSEDTYESVVAVMTAGDGRKPKVITSFESKTVPPNYRLRDLDTNSIEALTQFADPTPQIRKIKKTLVQYERSDGVPLSATLYLPEDHVEGTRLPLLVWAYPMEFNDSKTAAQVSGSQHRFTRMAGISHLVLATQGYAIMDAATMPVIGDPETMNDTFIEQIVASAQAAIDKAVDLGVADRARVAVGGHSYGAFMTANLLAHCDLFQAGIARSGAYNRTLTPFGFQSERRPFWEAKEVYMSISPFMHADKIGEPILLIHGENDNNSGTFPIQSKRLYQAIKGNGGTVRLCMLPKESHGYRAKQSVLHTQAEMIRWLDTYVKRTPQ